MFDNLKHNGLYRITYTSNDITFRDIEVKFDNHGKFRLHKGTSYFKKGS